MGRQICWEIQCLIGCFFNEQNILYLVVIFDCVLLVDIFIILDNVGVLDDVEVVDILRLELSFGFEVFEEIYEFLDLYNDFYFCLEEFVVFEREDLIEEELKFIYVKVVC